VTHVTAAVSESTFNELFDVLRDGFGFSDSNSGSFGPFTAGYSVAGSLRRGEIDLRSPNRVKIDELDVHWDTLEAFVDIDIEEVCVGGFCIIGIPFDGCAVRAPRICVFSGSPDIHLPLGLNGLLTSELSTLAEFDVSYATNRPPTMSYLQAQEVSPPQVNNWEVYVDPVTIDIDVFDWADIVGDLLDDAIDAAVDGILSPLPGWARDAISFVLGGVVDFVRALLDIGDDVQEWLSDLIGVSLGLFDFLLTVVADMLLSEPVLKVEDPYPVLEADVLDGQPRIPVKIPIAELGASVEEDTELVLEATVGGV
jgi:hypothetical protein